MNIINLFSLVLAIVLVISLVIAFQRRKKRSHIPQLRRIALLSEKKQLQIRNKDVINGQFIGLDSIKKVLILSHLEEPAEAIEIIPLTDIGFCKVVKETRDIVHRGRNRVPGEKETTRIVLMLYSFTRTHAAEFVFFDNEVNNMRDMPRLLKKAEFWNHKITTAGSMQFSLAAGN